MQSSPMTWFEIKHTLLLGLIFASRLFGLFMVLPVLILHTESIPGATITLIGVAVGIYGLSQALLQFPCGMLSDYFGRKPIIMIGLILFTIGSLVAAFSHSIVGLILGRAIQGAGAVGSPILALVADLTRDEVRTKAMAILGVSIGFTFILSILLGPILDAFLGLQGLFILSALLALGGIALFSSFKAPLQQKPQPWIKQLTVLIKNTELWTLNVNIFILHAVLTAAFILFPQKIQAVTLLTSSQVWRLYFPALLLSILCLVPLLRFADKGRWQRIFMQAALILLAGSIILFISLDQFSTLLLALTLFFTAFNFLEASLPAMASKVVATSKGSALGVYSFSQFLGMFAGGVLGGTLLEWWGPWGIGVGCALWVSIGWLALSKKRRNEQWQEASIKSF